MITDHGVIELIGMGVCMRWLARRADATRAATGNDKPDDMPWPQIRKVEITWWDDPETEIQKCKIKVIGQIGACGVVMPCPLKWNGEGKSGNLDFGPGDRVPSFRGVE